MIIKPNISAPVVDSGINNTFGYFNAMAGYTSLLKLPNAEAGNLNSSSYKNTGGTFYTEFTLQALPNTTAAIFEVSNQSGSSRVTTLIRTDGRIQLFSENNDSTQVNINTGRINVGSLNKLVIIAGEDNFASVLNGTTLGTDTFAQYPASADTFSFEKRIGDESPLTGDVSVLRYFTGHKTVEWAEGITA